MTSTFDGRAVRADASARSPHARRAALASFVGSTLEYYDFFIYASFSALAFNTLFFPDLGSFWGTIVSMATIGIGYVVRPLAALVFGHFGDTLGRKRMLVVTLVMMGVATSLIGCLPTYGAIGVAAPILLVLLRAVQAPAPYLIVGPWSHTNFSGLGLCRVMADGTSITLTDGIVRARYRDSYRTPGAYTSAEPSLLEPGEVYEYAIDLWSTAVTFQPGERIRVQVTSSSHPRWDRNLNTGQSAYESDEFVVAHQSVHTGVRHPSRVSLPVVR